MRSRACRPGSLGATECNQMTCGPGCQGSRSVLRSGSSAPELFQRERYHNAAAALRESSNGNRRMFPQGRSLHHPSCNCGNCSRGHHLPGSYFKDLLYRQSADAEESAIGLHSSQSHSHSQQNGYDRHCCGVGASFYQDKRSADNLIESLRSTPRSSRLSATGDFEQRNATTVCTGYMSRMPLKAKANESSSSSLDFLQCPEKVSPPGVLKNEIFLHGWYLMKLTSGETTTGRLPLPAVAVGGYRSPQMLQTELVQTTRVESRLEKSKLRTSDGVEVNLVGMIDLNKSIANGFSPALVKHFLIGFPSRWMYIMLNLNIRGSMLDFPSSSARQDMNSCAGRRQEPPVEEISALRPPSAPLFTPPSEGTWKDVLRSFSPTTPNSLPAVSSEINTTEQCDLDQEQSEEERNCSKVHRGADPQAESLRLERKTSFLTRTWPRSEAEATGVENTDEVANRSSLTGRSKLLWPCRLGLQAEMAGDAGDVVERSFSHKSDVVKDVPASVTPVHSLDEDVNELAEWITQPHETQIVGDCPNSALKTKVCREGPPNTATEDIGVVDLEDMTACAEDFAVDQGHDETELHSMQVPFTRLKSSRQGMGDLNRQSLENETRGVVVGTKPVNSAQSIDTGKRLRSGRRLLVVDKQMIEQGIVCEDAVEGSNTRKRRRNSKTIAGEGCEEMRSREPISSTEDLLVHHEDLFERGGLDQAPSTPSQTTTRPVNISPGITLVVDTPTTDGETYPARKQRNADVTRKLRSGRNVHDLEKSIEEPVLDIPTTAAETDLVSNLQNADDTKKLRSGRSLRPLDSLVVSPVIVPQILKTKKRGRSSESAAPVATCEDDHRIEREEQETNVDMLVHEGDSEISSRPTDDLCKVSAGFNRPVNRKRHAKVSKIYRSRRKKSCPESSLTTKPKLESSPNESCNSRRKNPKVGADKSFQMEDTEPAPKESSTKVAQSAKSTRRVQLKRVTSNCTRQPEKEICSGKRKSIVPPPLPAPRIADELKVLEAYGLKRSRFGRILVPPLAVWCNQYIMYDKDGSIIAISDTSGSKAESHTGSVNFTFPSDAGARKMQKKLVKAAQTNLSQK